jgi:CheY-like chemotaxis protein
MTTKRILLVEDEAFVAMSLSRALPRLGYQICRVLASGEEALESVETDQPDLILMDIHLVGAWDGIQTAERIRVRHNMPIVFMTGYDIGDIQEKTRHITNAAHVEKPIGVPALAQIIEATLAASALSNP